MVLDLDWDFELWRLILISGGFGQI